MNVRGGHFFQGDSHASDNGTIIHYHARIFMYLGSGIGGIRTTLLPPPVSASVFNMLCGHILLHITHTLMCPHYPRVSSSICSCSRLLKFPLTYQHIKFPCELFTYCFCLCLLLLFSVALALYVVQYSGDASATDTLKYEM